MSAMNLESYPPVFRLQNPQNTTNLDFLDDCDTTINKQEIQELDYPPIPVIDLQCLNLDILVEACKNWGLFRLVNHGIPSTLLTQLQDHSKKIFSFSFESKQALITNPFSYFWGTPVLTPSGTALSRGPKNMNWVEGFNVHLSQISLFQAEDPKLESFRVLLEEYGRHLTRIARTVFEAMAENLNLNPEKSKPYLSESTGLVRVYRYPQCSMADETLGMEAHTDSSVISILNQEQVVGGLEILKDDKWLNIQPVPNTLILNLGDMMQAISNDEYKSVKHRVKANKNGERFSICYFVFPDEGGVIQSSNYKPFTYSDFQAQVQKDLKTVGFKIGLERFKLTQAPEAGSNSICENVEIYPPMKGKRLNYI